MIQDLTSLFSKTASHIIDGVIKNGGIVGGVKISGANGVLMENDRLSNLVQKEIMDKAGVRGFISTDELPQYGINADDKKKILSACKAAAEDVVVLVADQRDKTMTALEIIASMLSGKTKKAAPKPKKKAAKPAKKAKAKKAAKAQKVKKVVVKKKAGKKK
jgi:Glu-tRNA(Gln) amidotransferase subunit E-like FAD-binding protein